jgi:hypothetical protein
MLSDYRASLFDKFFPDDLHQFDEYIRNAAEKDVRKDHLLPIYKSVISARGSALRSRMTLHKGSPF